MRQYIGARYMPKFMGTYDNTTAYEALSVVDNGMGTSYVANKPVPAGTPLTDTNYWAIYGASSGAIIALQDQIDELKDDLYDKFLQLKNKTIAIFGASNELKSYTQNENWVDDAATALTGIATIVNKSVAGHTLLNSISDYIADPDKNTYDIVVFCSTKNLYRNQTFADIVNGVDVFTPGNIDTAIDSLKNYKTLNQKFYFASCTPFVEAFKRTPMCVYDGKVKKAVERNGYNMLDMHSWLGVNDADSASYTSDNIHFKAEVAPIFASRFIKALLAGNEPFSNYSMKLTGADAWQWVNDFYNVPNTINFMGGGVVYADVSGKVYLYLQLQNDAAGYDFPTGTNIIETTFANGGIILSPAYVINHKNSIYSGTEIGYNNRAYGIRIDDPVLAGQNFLVTFGDIDSATSI